MSGIFVVNMY